MIRAVKITHASGNAAAAACGEIASCRQEKVVFRAENDSRGDRSVHGGSERRYADAVDGTGGARSYVLDMEVASGTYAMQVGNMKPLQQTAMLFNFGFSKEEGGGTSVFSRAAAHLVYAATSALNNAHNSDAWLTRGALRITFQWSTYREKLEVSPGGGHLNEGSASICLVQSDVSPGSYNTR